MLGRDFSLTGTVVAGRGIGARLLGIPTANIACHNEALPAGGVYAVRAALGRSLYGGVANLGCCPTVSACRPGRRRPRLTLEVHLFGTRANMRGKKIEVFFIEKIRAERRFGSLPALRRRILADIALAGQILARRERRPAAKK